MSRFDCVVVGEICIDLPIRPLPIARPLDEVVLTRVDPIHPLGGGIVPNSGIAMATLGLRTAAFGLVGDDDWATLMESLFDEHGIDREHVIRHPTVSTSTTAVLVAEGGEHCFAYHAGASRTLNASTLYDHIDLFRNSRFALLGYYALLPELEPELPLALKAISESGCQLALDAAGGGGCLEPLCDALPYLDFYLPSYDEGVTQTGEREPAKILSKYRSFTEKTVLGLKMGADGAVLCPAGDQLIPIPPVTPPGDVVDTTGAGDCFYAGLITGLCRGFSVEQSARIGNSAGACCTTQVGAIAGLRNYEETLALLEPAH